jgi:hypothetical protein
VDYRHTRYPSDRRINKEQSLNAAHKLTEFSPALLTLSVWILALAGSALTAAGPTHPVIMAAGALLALASMYGYPVLLTAIPELHAPQLSRRLAMACSGTIATAFVVEFLTGSNFAFAAPGTPVWTYPIGIVMGIALFVPFVIAARALRKAELAAGRDIPLGVVSAFLWLFYWPVGVFFFHKRLRYVLDRQATLELAQGHPIT